MQMQRRAARKSPRSSRQTLCARIRQWCDLIAQKQSELMGLDGRQHCVTGSRAQAFFDWTGIRCLDGNLRNPRAVALGMLLFPHPVTVWRIGCAILTGMGLRGGTLLIESCPGP